jgi:CheY-like chemotaxis protein
MERHAEHPTGPLPPAPSFGAAPVPARILLVEDDDDTRQLLALALGGQRHVVDQAASAPHALELLRRNAYHLVLTDYDLPGMTGSALLREAARQGLLRSAAAVVVTAHPTPEGVAPGSVIRKPLDLPGFLEQVRHILVAMNGDPGDGAASARDPLPASGTPAPVELVLYVSSDSPASLRARRHLESALAHFEPDRVRLEICDVGQDPARGEADHVVFTPTLVTRCGGVASWVLGDLGDGAMLMDLLHVCGLEPSP